MTIQAVKCTRLFLFSAIAVGVFATGCSSKDIYANPTAQTGVVTSDSSSTANAANDSTSSGDSSTTLPTDGGSLSSGSGTGTATGNTTTGNTTTGNTGTTTTGNTGGNTTAQAAAPAPCGVLSATMQLNQGQSLSSCSGQYKLILQTDGNVVVYAGGMPLWSPLINTGVVLAMQADGNLVAYSSSQAVWNSGTYGHPGAFTKMQDDGNLVVYGTDGTPLWNSHTNGLNHACTVFAAGSVLLPGERYQTCDAQFQVTIAGGNLIEYGPNGYARALTNTGTVAKLIMQYDGNLVAYTAANGAVWNTGTYGHTGAQLNIAGNGSMWVTLNGQALWAY